jgi:hypothetical protein
MPREVLLIEEKSGLNQDQIIQEQLIPSTFQEGRDFSDEGSMLLLKNHYAACYWQLHENFHKILC